MNYIECQVLTVKDGEELTVGNIAVYSIPKVGEYIWFSKERLGHTSSQLGEETPTSKR